MKCGGRASASLTLPAAGRCQLARWTRAPEDAFEVVELLLDSSAALGPAAPARRDRRAGRRASGHRLPDRLVELLLGERRRLGELGRGFLNPLAPVSRRPCRRRPPGLGTRIVASAARSAAAARQKGGDGSGCRIPIVKRLDRPEPPKGVDSPWFPARVGAYEQARAAHHSFERPALLRSLCPFPPQTPAGGRCRDRFRDRSADRLGSARPASRGAEAEADPRRARGEGRCQGGRRAVSSGAAAPPAGRFDCSGLVYWAYGRLGIELPAQLVMPLRRRGRPVARSSMKTGDSSSSGLGRVGIYIGRGRMVHAPHSGRLRRGRAARWVRVTADEVVGARRIART